MSPPSQMLTYIDLSEDNCLSFDLNTETVLKVSLHGDIKTKIDDNKIEYVGSNLRIIVNTTPLEWTLEINSACIRFKVGYCDFPEAPEVLAEMIQRYMARE